MGRRTWSEDWEERLSGAGCPMCSNQGAEDSGFGRRFLCGRYADVYLQRASPLPGYSVAVWKEGHVAEPFELAADGASGYWSEVLDAARAIHTYFTPAKLNFLILGNAVPHLHTHLLPRYLDDPAPGAPFPWDLVSAAAPLEEKVLEAQVNALRRVVGGRGG